MTRRMTSGAPRVMVLVVILRGTRGDHLVSAVMHEFSSGDVLLQMSRAVSNVMIAVVSLSLFLWWIGFHIQALRAI